MALGFVSDRLDYLSRLGAASTIIDLKPYGGFFISDGAKFCLSDRCGIPFDDASISDRDSLFIQQLLQPDIGVGQDISAFFVRRVFFQRLFDGVNGWYDFVSRQPIINPDNQPNQSIPRTTLNTTSRTINPQRRALRDQGDQGDFDPAPQDHRLTTMHQRVARTGSIELIIVNHGGGEDREFIRPEEAYTRTALLRDNGYRLVTSESKIINPEEAAGLTRIWAYSSPVLLADHQRAMNMRDTDMGEIL